MVQKGSEKYYRESISLAELFKIFPDEVAPQLSVVGVKWLEL